MNPLLHPVPLWAASDVLGGFLRCETCLRRQPIGDAAENQAWPKHCGKTMRWVLGREGAVHTPIRGEREDTDA